MNIWSEIGIWPTIGIFIFVGLGFVSMAILHFRPDFLYKDTDKD